MKLKKLFLYNFRNYQRGSWKFSDGINVFYGQNGHGKTNILEAIYFSAFGSSHRTFQESDLINNTCEEMSVAVNIEYLQVQKEIKIKKSGRKIPKEITVDNIRIKPRELIGELKITMFAPEDLQLVKSDPSLRRRFLDMQICQINNIYCLSLGRYNKILKQRNTLLKQIKEKKEKKSSLEVWDEQLCKEASYILGQRLKILAKIKDLMEKIYIELVANEKATLTYKRKENNGETFLQEIDVCDFYCWYKKQLKERINIDIERMNTGIGPHRDDIFFSIEEMPARFFASQGQQRSFILALKMAEIKLVKEECGTYPILLLDDVMSELDQQRKDNLLEFLDGRVQTFITITEKNIVQNFPNATFYKVEKGNVSGDIYE